MWKVTEKEFEKAKEIISKYEGQQSHVVRENVLNDCPTKDFEPGIPSGVCETDGHYKCLECKFCHPKLVPITMDEIKDGFVFFNFDSEEGRWNEVKVVGMINGLTDIENIDFGSEFCENVWSVRDGEITNINNSKRKTL